MHVSVDVFVLSLSLPPASLGRVLRPCPRSPAVCLCWSPPLAEHTLTCVTQSSRHWWEKLIIHFHKLLSSIYSCHIVWSKVLYIVCIVLCIVIHTLCVQNLYNIQMYLCILLLTKHYRFDVNVSCIILWNNSCDYDIWSHFTKCISIHLKEI